MRRAVKAATQMFSAGEKKKIRKLGAYTLIEVMIVLVIMATALGLVIPRIGKVPAGLKRAEAFKSINSSFYMASSMAAATGRPVQLIFDFDQNRIRIQKSGDAAGDAEKGNRSLFSEVDTYALPEGTVLDPYATDAFASGNPTYDFYPNSEGAGPMVSILIGGAARVTVDIDRLTGRPLVVYNEN